MWIKYTNGSNYVGKFKGQYAYVFMIFSCFKRQVHDIINVKLKKKWSQYLSFPFPCEDHDSDIDLEYSFCWGWDPQGQCHQKAAADSKNRKEQKKFHSRIRAYLRWLSTHGVCNPTGHTCFTFSSQLLWTEPYIFQWPLWCPYLGLVEFILIPKQPNIEEERVRYP